MRKSAVARHSAAPVAASLVPQPLALPHGGTWWLEPSSQRLWLSADLQRLLGVPSTATPAQLLALCAPATRRRVYKAMRRASLRRNPFSLPLELNTPSASPYQLWLMGEPELAPGKPLRLVGAVIDTQAQQDRLNARLAEGELELHEAQRIAKVGSWHWDIASNLTGCSPVIYEIFGINPMDAPPHYQWLKQTYTAESFATLRNCVRLAAQQGQAYQVDVETQGGRWVTARGEPIYNSQGQVVALRGTAQDITDLHLARAAQKEREQGLAAANRLREAILEASPFAIIATNVDGTIQTFNAAAECMLGYSRHELVGNATPLILFQAQELVQRALALQQEFGTPIPPTFEVLTHKPARGMSEELEWHVMRKDRSQCPINLTVTPLRDDRDGITGYLCIAYDITERKRREDYTHHIAHHDALTGLPNRVLMNERLALALANAAHQQAQVGLMLVDLDHFKRVNDSLGHDVGDEMLRVVADRLLTCVRTTDTVARMGGDEFVVLMPDVRDPKAIERVGQQIVTSISTPLTLGKHELAVSPSVGVSIYPQHGVSVSELLKNADTAMYKAKASGRACMQVFDAELERKAVSRMQTEGALRLALKRREFEMHYQPKICLATGRIYGMEALIRWRHPERGMVSPAEFIPVAEDAGLIVPISEWLLEAACIECLNIQARTGQIMNLAVNLSPRQLEKGRLQETLKRVLRDTGFNPENLELEITEGVLMERQEDARQILHEIRDLGITLAIDDFGTGFSSLSYLTQFPINTLKIDRSFVNKSLDSPRDSAVVQAIIAMAQGLSLQVVAEGVETSAQLAYLVQRHCDVAQGFFFGKGVPAHQFASKEQTSANALIEVKALRAARQLSAARAPGFALLA